MPTLTAAGATALPAERFATGTGILTMARQIGAVLGVAVLVVLIGSRRTHLVVQDAFHHGWYEMAAAELITALASLLIPRSPAMRPATVPAAGRTTVQDPARIDSSSAVRANIEG